MLNTPAILIIIIILHMKYKYELPVSSTLVTCLKGYITKTKRRGGGVHPELFGQSLQHNVSSLCCTLASFLGMRTNP